MTSNKNRLSNTLSPIVKNINEATNILNSSIRIHGIRNFLNIGMRMTKNVDLRDLISATRGYSKYLIPIQNQLATFANIELTYDCNRTCKGCYIPNHLKKQSEIISEQTLDHAVYGLSNLNMGYIGLLGGEPLSEECVPLIYTIAKKYPSTLFIVNTNGDYIASHGLGKLTKVHNLIYGVSIDGIKSHNKIRGRNSLENVLKTFEILHNEKKFYGAAIGFRRENIDEITSYDFLKLLEDKGVQYMHFIKIRETSSDSDLSYEEFDNNIKKISPYFKKIPIVIFFGTGSKDKKASYFKYNYPTISPNGDLRVVRTNLNDESVGNIMTENMQDLLIKFKDKYSKENL